MITCPWCGTNYTAFQSNCKNCGGPLPAPSEVPTPEPRFSQPEAIYPEPPPAPRAISPNYVWRLLSTDGAAIVAFVFLLLGAIFTFLGFILTVAIITAFVGLPFAGIGLILLAVGGGIGRSRYQTMQRTVEVLKTGQAAAGKIVNVEENLYVRVNQRHPWTITYQFQVGGQARQGKVTTLNVPGASLQPGKKAWVLYLPEAPEHNTLYPHP
jgi:hypothetical protein